MRKNILFVLTDNQRADLLGCAGHPVVQTPRIDELAENGVRFSNAFATTPICAASRASFLTGCYERRHRFTFHTPPLGRAFTDASYPAMMRAVGYRTGFIGKFGVCADGIEPSLEDPAAIEMMFDLFDNYEHWTDEGYLVTQQDGSIRHLTDVTGDKAIEFLRSCATQTDVPFCLSVSFNAPHAQDGDPQPYIWPASESHLYSDVKVPEPANADPAFFEGLPAFIRESESRRRWDERFSSPEDLQRNVRGLYRMISGVDRNVGRMLDELGRLSLSESTVVVFASDHGMYYGERGLCDCWQLNEEPLRIPLVVFDPSFNRDVRGSVIDEMALNIDVAPTLAEFGGLLPHPMAQGRSLLPLMGGRKMKWRSEFFCEHLFDRADIPKSEGVRTEAWKYIRYFEESPLHEELYDLRKDRRESVNLSGEPLYSEVLRKMRERCDMLGKEVA